jgi:carboxylesterase type B
VATAPLPAGSRRHKADHSGSTPQYPQPPRFPTPARIGAADCFDEYVTDVFAHPASGSLRGTVADDGIARFLGIPYGRAPFGALRFAAPEPADSWNGTRDALEFGPTSPKPDEEHSQSQLDFLDDPAFPGEDCLNLNVWTPDPTATRLPVMVWIHGGAYLSGSSAQPLYDGTSFARDGVVFVSPNYRLGVEGFGLLPDAPSNRGVLDLLLALEWVRDNAAAFGGDPDNVTVFGESAGAGLVLALLALDRGLFRRAVISSAALTASLSPGDAAKVVANIAAQAGVSPTAEGFRAVDPQRLANLSKLAWLDMSAQPAPQRWGATTVAAGMTFTTAHDGELLPRPPLDMILDGAGSGVELLIGCTSDEMLALVSGGGPGDAQTAERARRFLELNGAPPDAYQVYEHGYGTPSAALAAAMRDAMFLIPAIRIADSRRSAPTFVYEFGWQSPIPGLGAAHGLDIGFFFDNLGHSPIEGPQPSRAVAGAMHGAFVRFATVGDPGWSRYEPDARPVMVFNDESRVVADPHDREREMWGS